MCYNNKCSINLRLWRCTMFIPNAQTQYIVASHLSRFQLKVVIMNGDKLSQWLEDEGAEYSPWTASPREPPALRWPTDASQSYASTTRGAPICRTSTSAPPSSSLSSPRAIYYAWAFSPKQDVSPVTRFGGSFCCR